MFNFSTFIVKGMNKILSIILEVKSKPGDMTFALRSAYLMKLQKVSQ